MAIGFIDESATTKTSTKKETSRKAVKKEPVRSLVWVRFETGQTLAYYNDQFDLQMGDTVFVEGKLYGLPGEIVDIAYSFKVPLDTYKKVIAQARKRADGKWRKLFSTAVSFDKNSIDFEEYATWVFPPQDEENPNQWVSAGGFSFPLGNFSQSKDFDEVVFDKGFEMLKENAVKYFSYRSGKCKAVVKGRKYYAVEFDYKDGVVTNALCDCPCASVCKHIAAALIYFSALIKRVEQDYSDEFDSSQSITSIDYGEFVDIISENLNTITIK